MTTTNRVRRRAVGYARISLIVDDSTAIARQKADIQAAAEREGVELVDILIDEGKSGRKAREKADRAIAMLAEGDVDVLIVWKLDRLTRGGVGALVPLFDALDTRELAARSGAPSALFVTTDGHRSDSPAWRIIAAVLAEVARAEVENTAARAASAMHYRRTVTHRFAGGASVPYGYASIPADDGVGKVLVLSDDEAPIVRELVDRALSGVGPFRLAQELNTRLVPTSKSPYRRAARKGQDTTDLDRGTWTRSTVKSLLTSHTLLGRQTHRGTLLKGDDGVPVAVWPPIVTLDEHERLGRLFTPSSDREAPHIGRAARLLSGILYCAHCDAKLYVTTSGGKPIYSCPSGWNHTGDRADKCPSPKIDAGRIEGHIEEHILGIAGHWPELKLQRVAANPHAAAELQEVEAAIVEVTLAEDDDTLDEDAATALFLRKRKLMARRVNLRQEAGHVAEELRPTGRTIREAWDADEHVEARRTVALGALDHIALSRADFPSQPVADRIRLFWTS